MLKPTVTENNIVCIKKYVMRSSCLPKLFLMLFSLWKLKMGLLLFFLVFRRVNLDLRGGETLC